MVVTELTATLRKSASSRSHMGAVAAKKFDDPQLVHFQFAVWTIGGRVVGAFVLLHDVLHDILQVRGFSIGGSHSDSLK